MPELLWCFSGVGHCVGEGYVMVCYLVYSVLINNLVWSVCLVIFCLSFRSLKPIKVK